MKKKIVAIQLDDSLYAFIVELAREQRRTPTNFIHQFLSVSLDGSVDREALFKKMNPALVAGLERHGIDAATAAARISQVPA